MPKATTGAQVLEREPTKEEMIAEWKRSMDEGVDPFIVIPNGWDTPEDARRKAGNEMIWEAKKIRAQADAEKNAIEKQRLKNKADDLAVIGRKMGGVISREIDQELARNIVANERILDARMAWLDAQKKGDEAGKKQAEQDAREARKSGGTIPNCDTEEMKRMVGNQMILSAKILWAEAHKEHDPANKEKAEKLAAKGRTMGGTITLQDDLADAQRMVGNEMIWGAKQIWATPTQAGGDASGVAASAKYAREHMGGTITIDHSIEEAGRVVADNRSHPLSKYSNAQDRAWNGVYDKTEWENNAQYLYNMTRKPGGDKWANDRLYLAEKILYGSPKEAEWAKQNFNKAAKPSGGEGSSQGAGYDSSGTQNPDPGPIYNHAKEMVRKINKIDQDKFGKELQKFAEIYKKNIDIYERISKKTGVPPQLIAAIHYREASCDFSAYLHNGEKLGKVTKKVPKGKFFTDFEEAAVDAILDKKDLIKFYHLSVTSNDLVAMMAYAEMYNGKGYLKNDLVSPYAYSGTNVYTKGKYVSDGKFDPNVVDRQPGVYILLKAIESVSGSAGNGSSGVQNPSPKPTPKPTPTPTPSGNHIIKGVPAVDQIPFSASGCAIASFTMVANFYGADTDFNSVSKKYAPGNAMDFPRASKAVDLSYQRYDVGKSFTKNDVYRHIRASIDKGLPCIVSSDGHDRNGKASTHFAVVIGYTNEGNKDSDIIIIDPWGGVQTTLDHMQIYKSKGQILSVREFKPK
ncbi:C39 family peptidase [Paenibacillus tyrfis]|uniref:C39 family peptidase n=1 Tax=Paenibacillus tyrfis TaxID=1501230 RepID=UPI0006893D74|nr:C39 family peptidase [Paenibacillus tyrfis]